MIDFAHSKTIVRLSGRTRSKLYTKVGDAPMGLGVFIPQNVLSFLCVLIAAFSPLVDGNNFLIIFFY